MADIIRKVDIEAWALRSLERLMAGPGKKRAEEDNRVDFLAALPPVEKAAENARQLAGYLNAARSEPLLWILGVEAKNKKLNGQVTLADFEQWWQAVARHFEGLAPFYTLVPIVYQEQPLVAVLFDSDRLPFVIKTGNVKGKTANYEVPWREGSSLRSAGHNELVRMLYPLSQTPVFEVVKGQLVAVHRSNRRMTLGAAPGETDSVDRTNWQLNLEIYITPPVGRSNVTNEPLALPFHNFALFIEIPGLLPVTRLEQTELTSALTFLTRSRGRNPSQTITNSATEILVKGPGTISFNGSVSTNGLTQFAEDGSVPAALATVKVRVAGFEITNELNSRLVWAGQPMEGTAGTWFIDNSL